MTQLVGTFWQGPGFAAVVSGGSLAASTLLAGLGMWSFWRARKMLAILPTIDERLATLASSTAMLTDTTEACFKAIAVQLQAMQSGTVAGTAAATTAATATRPSAVARTSASPSRKVGRDAARRNRQQRIVGAARRGESLAAIAARENVAESEVALRVHVNGSTQLNAANDSK